MKKDIVDWKSENDFCVEGVNFFATVDPALYHTRKSDEGSLLIVKTREMIETELQIVSHLDVKNVVDIGIWQGGSVALLDALFKPDLILAIERSNRDLPALEAYIVNNDRSSNVLLKKGVNQADREVVLDILNKEFGDTPIDLAVDDASHQYEETKVSFDLIFPRLREGGVFVIEDWQWSTLPVFYESAYFQDRKGLANLVLQCVITCAARPDVVSEVKIFPHSVAVKRGPADLTSETFEISAYAINKGKAVPLVL